MTGALLMLAALFAVSFLLGSIPWGVIVSKVFFKKDIRHEGSGNIGATNAARGMGLKGGAAVFALDAGKGVLAGALAWLVWAPLLSGAFADDTISLFAGIYDGAAPAHAAFASGQVVVLCTAVAFIGCTLGHIFCPWLGLRGGKGISVAFGCEFFALGPLAALIDLAVFAVFAVSTRWVSLGSLMAAVAVPIMSVWVCGGCWPAMVLIDATAVVVIWAHRGNIRRLLKGEESKFGAKGKTAARPQASDRSAEDAGAR
ncbi:glycerol-3-phosphate 1-O-acyltransferase PlsY [Adlercreutzia murintestinalis]|uniref:glycerol-3-phosphate 1-O-acyltransferase PlsY n=1 Tax=Adlercreutzia murintestinalis TaxID=2941325 RepID=UPI00203A675C|nr:glycerol-3-phosphate 1-O-acyltransferase PlsY [Adlercreutzia murintestinalis]